MVLWFVGDGFICLIKMIVVLIVFLIIVIGVVGSGSMKKMGSFGIKMIIWFEVIMMFVLGFGLLLVNVLKFGVGFNFFYFVKKDIYEFFGYIEKVVDLK